MDVGQPDEKSIITYVSSLYDAMPKNLPPQQYQQANNNGAMVKEKRGLVQEYSMLFKSLHRWLNESLKLMETKTPLPNDYIELKVIFTLFSSLFLIKLVIYLIEKL